MKYYRGKVWLSCFLAAWFLAAGTAFATEPEALKNGYTQDDSVIVYINDDGREIQNVYIGNEAAESYSEETAGGARTVVLVDNSLSIAQKYREDIKTFLTDLTAARNDGDLFTMATFAEDMHYLVEDSSDYLAVKDQIAALQFENQDTYFNKTLYQMLENLENRGETCYTSIIIIADGVENEKLGYTDEELEKKITESLIPVYTLGCTAKGNEENLKKMFALSRLSGGESFLMDEVPVGDILRAIKEDGNVRKVTIIPPKTVCDGSKKNVRISFGEDSCQSELTMPFVEAVSETEPVTEAGTAELETEMETEPLQEPDRKPSALPLLIAAAGAAAAVIFLVCFLKTGKKKKTDSSADVEAPASSGGSMDTEPVSARDETGSATNPLVSKRNVRLVLQDKKQTEKSFEYPLRNQVILGRDGQKCQIVVDYDKSVSGVHCMIFRRENRYYVRDIGTNGIASSNGTFVDGRMAAPELELHSGSTLKLGRVEFKVTFR